MIKRLGVALIYFAAHAGIGPPAGFAAAAAGGDDHVADAALGGTAGAAPSAGSGGSGLSVIASPAIYSAMSGVMIFLIVLLM